MEDTSVSGQFELDFTTLERDLRQSVRTTSSVRTKGLEGRRSVSSLPSDTKPSCLPSRMDVLEPGEVGKQYPSTPPSVFTWR